MTKKLELSCMFWAVNRSTNQNNEMAIELRSAEHTSQRARVGPLVMATLDFVLMSRSLINL
jgi:hypothetical protein